MGVGLDLTAGIGVDAREILICTLAGLKSAILGVVGSVVGTSDTVEDVFTVAGGVRASRVTGLEAEEVPTEEADMEG